MGKRYPKQTINLKIFVLFITLNFSLFSFSQFHELGGFFGGSNYIGDIGSTNYISPNNYALGLIYKWNMTTRYSFRASAIIANIQKSDYTSKNINRFLRSYKFDNNIQEFSGGLEINFEDFNLHNPETKFTPFIFLGINYFGYDLFYHDPTNKNVVNYGKDESISIPIIFGVKTNPSPLFVIGFEIGARYALTDNIDGSKPVDPFSNNDNLIFGNINNNDWYVFSGITISFTFGDLPCYCKE